MGFRNRIHAEVDVQVQHRTCSPAAPGNGLIGRLVGVVFHSCPHLHFLQNWKSKQVVGVLDAGKVRRLSVRQVTDSNIHVGVHKDANMIVVMGECPWMPHNNMWQDCFTTQTE